MSEFRNLLIQKAKADNVILPKEFLQIDYIESNGNLYIDLGWKITSANMNTTLRVKDVKCNVTNELYYLLGAAVTNQCLHGLGVLVSVNQYNSQVLRFLYNAGNPAWGGTGLLDKGGDIIELEYQKAFVYKNFKEKPLVQTTLTTLTLFPNYNVHLFTCNAGGVLTSKASFKLCYLSFSINGNIIHEYIPCYRKLDKKPGIFDTVTELFLINKGSGEFIKGPDSFNPTNEIDANGHPYVDMDVKLPDGTPVYFAPSNLTTTGLADSPEYLGQYWSVRTLTSDVANDILGGTWTTCSIEALEALIDTNKYLWKVSGNLVTCSLKTNPSKFLTFYLAGNSTDAVGTLVWNKGYNVYIIGSIYSEYILAYLKNNNSVSKMTTSSLANCHITLRPVLTRKLPNWG